MFAHNSAEDLEHDPLCAAANENTRLKNGYPEVNFLLLAAHFLRGRTFII
jgi:hypothetical protein